MAATKQQREVAQKSADAYIELAQVLEKAAKDLKARAKHYRAGELLPHYTMLPAEACQEMRHPAARALDFLDVRWSITNEIDRIQASLREATKGGK